MKDFGEMTVTIKLKSYELQPIGSLLKRAEETNNQNIDTMELNIEEKMFLISMFKRIKKSAWRKADKLEMLGNEFKNSMGFC